MFNVSILFTLLFITVPFSVFVTIIYYQIHRRLTDAPDPIQAKMVAQHFVQDSAGNQQLVRTIAVRYGRIVHAEFLRHRVLSRGVKSSRAIPGKRLRREMLQDPYIPVSFGSNKPGMQADHTAGGFIVAARRYLWLLAGAYAWCFHWVADKVLRGHKEWINRLIEPWLYTEEVITGVEWDNFFNLRIHKDAQPDIMAIAAKIYALFQETAKTDIPVLQPGRWHVPFVTLGKDGIPVVADEHEPKRERVADWLTAIQCSAARNARASYANHDKSMPLYEKDYGTFVKLVTGDKLHASPFEHIVTGYPSFNTLAKIEADGELHGLVRHIVRGGNLTGVLQLRNIIEYVRMSVPRSDSSQVYQTELNKKLRTVLRALQPEIPVS